MYNYLQNLLERFINGLNESLGLDFQVLGIEARYLVYAVTFLGALMAFEGLRQLLVRGENREEAINRRIRMRAKGKQGEEILALLKPPRKKGILNDLPFVGDLPVALTSAGINIPPGGFLALLGTGFVVVAAFGTQFYPPAISFPAAAVLCIVAPLALLGTAHSKRLEKMTKQLPDALDLMARGLRVGHPLNTTLQSVADEMGDPIGTEFGIIVDQVAYGDDLPDAMREMAERVDKEDIRYLAIAIAMQHGTGGDLARVLNTLSRVIRSRHALRRKVHAISSEGRLTAIILSGLPFAIAGFVTVTNPGYYGDVMHFPTFWPVAAAIFAAVVLNAIILFKLVHFRI